MKESTVNATSYYRNDNHTKTKMSPHIPSDAYTQRQPECAKC